MSTAGAIVRFLSRAGPSRASDVEEALNISRSAFQRGVSDRVLVTGRARATRYAARRDLEGVHTPVPVYEIDAVGAARHALTLHPVAPFGHYVEPHVDDVASGFFETDPRGSPVDLPWFLHDMAPSGFLGRAWVRAHADRGYPADLARWTGDDVLSYATRYGVDATGAFVVGAFALELVEQGLAVTRVAVEDQADAYPALAERALAEAAWGSSPGGDQPKFTVHLVGDDVVPCIVKFSPPVDTPGGRRWADLLAVEHTVHDVLREHGIDAARSHLVDAGNRRFLVVRRFDRHGPRGRSGLVSLHAFDRMGVAGDLGRWSTVTAHLVSQGRLSPEDHERVRWLEAFGALIANTDMHPGNLSLRLRGTTIVGLAPVYDMLPMFHAPHHGGEVPGGVYRPAIDPHQASAGVRSAARVLWERVADLDQVSDAFKEGVVREM